MSWFAKERSAAAKVRTNWTISFQNNYTMEPDWIPWEGPFFFPVILHHAWSGLKWLMTIHWSISGLDWESNARTDNVPSDQKLYTIRFNRLAFAISGDCLLLFLVTLTKRALIAVYGNAGWTATCWWCGSWRSTLQAVDIGPDLADLSRFCWFLLIKGDLALTLLFWTQEAVSVGHYAFPRN